MIKKNALIVTHPLGKNIGGLLQALALQKFIEKHGIAVVTADVRPPALRGIGLAKYYVAGFLKNPSISLLLKSKFRPFGLNQKFLAENIRTTRCINNYSDLGKFLLQNPCNFLLVGSDQVWRPKYVTDLRIYFLDFFLPDTKKISYAASFGVSQWEYSKDEQAIASRALVDFSMVTVRESEAVELCKERLGVEAQHVCDPTLLHDAHFYERYESSTFRNEHKYVFSYILDLDDYKRNAIATGAEKLGLTFRCVRSTSYGLVDSEGCLYAPGDWLSSIRNAEFVFTDSYHGVLFSIIYRKPFYVFLNEGRGTSRFTSILAELGLQDRILNGRFSGELAPVKYDEHFESNLKRFVDSSKALLSQEL